MDTISQNKNTVTSFIDALFTKGDLGAVDEYLAEEFVNHDPPMGVPADREGMRQAGAMFRAAFPDWHSDQGLLVGEGDLVIEQFTASGNEYGREDVNKFAALAESADPVRSLDRATRGHRPASARYREIMGPLGLGDELRTALIAGQQCWGVLCLHREDASHGFDDREIDLIRRIAPHAAEGLRRAVTIGPVAAAADNGSPGIIVLARDLALISMTPDAARWLAELDEAEPGRHELPMAVYAAAAPLARLEEGEAAPQRPASIRLRGRGGRWLSVHAARLGGEGHIGVVIEPAPAAQIGSLLLSAYGLTSAQSRVVALVIRGHSTRQIVQELHISANTVQEHLTAAFDKFGVRSRRELVAAILTGRR